MWAKSIEEHMCNVQLVIVHRSDHRCPGTKERALQMFLTKESKCFTQSEHILIWLPAAICWKCCSKWKVNPLGVRIQVKTSLRNWNHFKTCFTSKVVTFFKITTSVRNVNGITQLVPRVHSLQQYMAATASVRRVQDPSGPPGNSEELGTPKRSERKSSLKKELH